MINATHAEEGAVTKSELLEARNGTLPIAVCEECREQYYRKRRDQRFCTSRCAGKFNAKIQYGPTGKPAKVEPRLDLEEVVEAAQWLEPPTRPLQPWTDAEIDQLADLVGVVPAKVRGIAWLTALKLEMTP